MRKIKPEKPKEMSVGLDAPKEYYPHFSIGLKHLPEAEKWKIGSTYFVTLELKQTDMSMHKGNGYEGGHVGFDITGIEVGEKPKKNYKELPEEA